VLNLFDITQGNYRVSRMISYPTLRGSQVILDVAVKAVSESEWVTDIYVKGVYEGPNDIVANKDYRIEWTMVDGRLLEAGNVTLVRASGKSIRQTWSSIITPERASEDLAQLLKKFPRRGQIVSVSVSPFDVGKNGMSYTWNGIVRKQRNAKA
jgi:hypothetical protein